MYAGRRYLLDVAPDKCETVMYHPAVIFLPRQVEVLPRVGAVVVQLQASHVLHVVAGDPGHVPAQPGCTPPARVSPPLPPPHTVAHVPDIFLCWHLGVKPANDIRGLD